jgi:hypothetical protein
MFSYRPIADSQILSGQTMTRLMFNPLTGDAFLVIEEQGEVGIVHSVLRRTMSEVVTQDLWDALFCRNNVQKTLAQVDYGIAFDHSLKTDYLPFF